MRRVRPPAPPRLPARSMQTYAIRRPTATHTRPASCAEVECDAWRLGWLTTVDESTDLGQRQAGWIRGGSRRRFTETRTPVGLTEFRFPPEQRCFASDAHRAPIDRPPLYVVAGGDYRGNPLRIPLRVHRSPEDWRDDFGEHQQRLSEAQQRG